MPAVVGAQSIPRLTAIDFSKAEISQSGPESFYVRNVVLSDETVSLTISLNTEGFWQISDVVSESKNLLPANLVLDFATLEAVDDTTIGIDWIIYNGSILSGKLSLSGEDISVSKEFSSRGSFSDTSIDYPKALGELLAGRESNALTAALAEVRSEYEEKLAALKASYDSVISERDALSKKHDAVQAQLSSLKADNAKLKTQLDELSKDVDTATADGLMVPEALAQSYIDKLDALTSEISALNTKITQLETKIVEMGKTVSTPVAVDTKTSDEATLKLQLAELHEKNTNLASEMASLETSIREELLGKGFIAVIRPALTNTLLSSFDTSEAQLGLWHVGSERATQIDPGILFGKLLLPLSQGASPVLYSFNARSTDPPDEWVGFGLHIFVENVEKRGYGLGDSLLVWLTRDREVYKNNYTYLQLYRSDDDIHMGRVMDAVIQEPITESIQIDVLYEPVRQYITIAVDGEEKIRYKTWFGIEAGVQVALRSLGTAEFTDLSVTSKP